MIDIKALLLYIWRYKWLLVIVPLVSMAVTFFLVKNLPDKYISRMLISTGLTDASQQVAGRSMDYFGVGQQFGNMIEMVTMRQVVDKVSLQLALHDLENTGEAFKPFDELVEGLSQEQRREIIAAFKSRLVDYKPLTTADNSELPLFDVITSMGYDSKALLEDLIVQRNAESDFIEIVYESTDPELSAFVVNTFGNEFIRYYNTITMANETKAMALLDSMLREKERIMQEKNAALKGYKLGSGVINLDAQSGILLKQISDYEDRLSQNTREIQSLRGAIKRINDQLNDPGNLELGGSNTDNAQLVRLDNQLAEANRIWVQNGFRASDKRVVDSLQNVRAALVAGSTGRYATNPRQNRQNLIDERMKMQTALSLAENSMASINTELSSLRARFNSMAPADANVQNLEREAEVATQEYLEALNRFNQANVQKRTSARLNIAEYGIPGLPSPPKRVLFVLLAGFASLSLLMSVLVIWFIMDRSVTSAAQLERISGLKVAGAINYIQENSKDLRDIWGDEAVPEYAVYKEVLRSLRFDIDKELAQNGHRVIGITSIKPGDGKTFVVSGLAYAFAMIGKKVLIIGDDYPNLLSLIKNDGEAARQDNFETFIVRREIQVSDRITILNRNPKQSSLLELKSESSIKAAFDVLRKEFDIILIDLHGLREINQVKEWMIFADRTYVVFPVGDTLLEKEIETVKNLKDEYGFGGWILNKERV